jgi:hypothetical protein
MSDFYLITKFKNEKKNWNLVLALVLLQVACKTKDVKVNEPKEIRGQTKL